MIDEMTTYPKNFITKVIARVDFQPILKLKSREPTDFQEAIRDAFPRFRKTFSMGIAIKPGEAPVASGQPVIWEFENREKNAKIELNHEHIAFILDKYVSFESFFPNVELIYNAFNNIYKPGLIKRIGLRFINEIILRGNPFDWDGYINPNLYCTIKAFPDLSKFLTRIMSQMHINLEDRMVLFQFGIFNSEHPNIIAQKEFILDYDCYSQEECEPGLVLGKVKLFYEDIKTLFKLCRGEKLIRIMKGEENEGK